MWYEDRHPGQAGYAIAVSDTPTGPFYTIANSVKMHGQGRSDGSGDFTIFVDDKDSKAYHVRDGFVIEELSDDYLSGSGNIYTFKHHKVPKDLCFSKDSMECITFYPGRIVVVVKAAALFMCMHPKIRH